MLPRPSNVILEEQKLGRREARMLCFLHGKRYRVTPCGVFLSYLWSEKTLKSGLPGSGSSLQACAPRCPPRGPPLPLPGAPRPRSMTRTRETSSGSSPPTCCHGHPRLSGAGVRLRGSHLARTPHFAEGKLRPRGVDLSAQPASGRGVRTGAAGGLGTGSQHQRASLGSHLTSLGPRPHLQIGSDSGACLGGC